MSKCFSQYFQSTWNFFTFRCEFICKNRYQSAKKNTQITIMPWNRTLNAFYEHIILSRSLFCLYLSRTQKVGYVHLSMIKKNLINLLHCHPLFYESLRLIFARLSWFDHRIFPICMLSVYWKCVRLEETASAGFFEKVNKRPLYDPHFLSIFIILYFYDSE